MKIKIYYHHTDAGGVVYYARYLDFLEEARTEFLFERGISVEELARQKTLFVVSRQEIDYRLPSFYGDTLFIDTRLGKIGKVSMEFECRIKNQYDKIIAEAKTVMACVDENFKLRSIPDAVRAEITKQA